MAKCEKWECATYKLAAETLGVSLWRLRYAVDSGYLPPPVVVPKRRPLFSPEQVEAMRSYFEREDEARGRKADPGPRAGAEGREEKGR
jgi:hypothetical protein